MIDIPSFFSLCSRLQRRLSPKAATTSMKCFIFCFSSSPALSVCSSVGGFHWLASGFSLPSSSCRSFQAPPCDVFSSFLLLSELRPFSLGYRCGNQKKLLSNALNVREKLQGVAKISSL